MENNNNYVAYEYSTIIAKRNIADLYCDNMHSFGWKIAEKVQGTDGVTLKFKRDRELPNKNELAELQRQFEQEVAGIAKLERSKTQPAAITALSVGVVGTAFTAGSVFCVTAPTPLVVPTIILGAIGLSLWAIPYFIYKKMINKQSGIVTPRIDKRYDNMYSVCKKAKSLCY